MKPIGCPGRPRGVGLIIDPCPGNLFQLGWPKGTMACGTCHRRYSKAEVAAIRKAWAHKVEKPKPTRARQLPLDELVEDHRGEEQDQQH